MPIWDRGDDVPETTNRMGDEWLRLLTALQAEMNRGTPPADPAVRQLVQQGLAGLNKLTGGDSGALQKLIDQYRANPGIGAAFGLDPATFAYIMRAISAN